MNTFCGHTQNNCKQIITLGKCFHSSQPSDSVRISGRLPKDWCPSNRRTKVHTCTIFFLLHKWSTWIKSQLFERFSQDYLPTFRHPFKELPNNHGLRTPREEIAFTAQSKIHSQSQIFRYGQSIFCLPHQPNFSDIFDLCLHLVSVVRANNIWTHRMGLASCSNPQSLSTTKNEYKH